jgi:hypothetical protein
VVATYDATAVLGIKVPIRAVTPESNILRETPARHHGTMSQQFPDGVYRIDSSHEGHMGSACLAVPRGRTRLAIINKDEVEVGEFKVTKSASFRGMHDTYGVLGAKIRR